MSALLASTSTSVARTVLRKRKRIEPSDTGVLHLSSSPSPSHDASSESAYEPDYSGPPSLRGRPDGTRFACTFQGCTKVYTKPSRLAEHERSHTGERPFVCDTCHKSYLRESHLQAHVRSHLPYSERPLVCDAPGCEKRFWTTQHLRIHRELHGGEKPFKCTNESCTAAFVKHHQLREHICTVHAPSGTKSYMCEHAGCTKSFATNQKLRTHMKTHDDKRYTCSRSPCLSITDSPPVYYSTWTALQHHIRTVHPPTCPYPSCNGKVFSTQNGLRAHLKIHEQREMEDDLMITDSDAEDSCPKDPPRKKRRGGEVGRDWICDVEGCNKDFKSKKALTNHRNVNHLGRRDFICPYGTCKRAFGYKHLLQRHLAKLHASDSSTSNESDHSDNESDEEKRSATDSPSLDIDDITGKNYIVRSRQLLTRTNILRCPYPDLDELVGEARTSAGSSKRCEYVFSRAYDLRRHLQSEHTATVDKDTVDEWVKAAKRMKGSSS